MSFKLPAMEEKAADTAGPTDPDVKLKVRATKTAIKARTAPYSVMAWPFFDLFFEVLRFECF